METVTVIRSSGPSRDHYGKRADSTPTSTVVPGCRIAPGASPEILDQAREGQHIEATLYAPLGTDLVHTDQVRLANGELFDVVSSPRTWVPSTEGPGGVVVALTRSEG